jgi:hypothetical protein
MIIAFGLSARGQTIPADRPAMPATAIELGPRFEVPVEWVWRFDPRTRDYVRVSPVRDFAVASNGSDFFVAWSQRALVGTVGPAGEPPRTTRAGVFGIRIDATGNVLDPVPIALPLSGSDASFWDLSNQWLAFAASSDSYLACSGGCARVDSCGTVLDAKPIPVPYAGLPSSGPPVVVSDGEDQFVLVDNQMFSVAPKATVVTHPIDFTIGSVASDGDKFLNVTNSEITLFQADGATQNATPFPFQALSQPAVTFDGEDYLVLWSGRGPEGPGKYVTRVSSDGVPLDTSARLALSDFLGESRRLRISFDGLNAVAAWCSLCVSERNVVPIAVIQARDPISATQAGLAGPVLTTLAVASNSMGVSIVVVDGYRPWLPLYLLSSFFPVVQLVKTWVPSPERSERIDRRPWCKHDRSREDE